MELRIVWRHKSYEKWILLIESKKRYTEMDGMWNGTNTIKITTAT